MRVVKGMDSGGSASLRTLVPVVTAREDERQKFQKIRRSVQHYGRFATISRHLLLLDFRLVFELRFLAPCQSLLSRFRTLPKGPASFYYRSKGLFL